MGAHFLWFGGVWGRKDCFPGADGSTITQVTGADPNAETISIYDADGNTELTEDGTGYRKINITTSGVINVTTSMIYSVKNPLTFIYNTTTPYDWYATLAINQDNTLWGDGSIKSTYDPCPKGWRVPTDASKTYGDFSTVTMTLSGSGTNVANGRKYIHMGWFPAAGYRNFNSGVFGVVGSIGCCRSASISGTDARHLRFDMSDVNPGYTNYRAWALSVRCVQE